MNKESIILISIVGIIIAVVISSVALVVSVGKKPTPEILSDNNYDYVWKCIEWEDKCNNLELATDRNSQFYVKTGEIDTEKCADKCTIYTLRKIKKGYQQAKLERVFQLINKTTYDRNGSVDFV